MKELQLELLKQEIDLCKQLKDVRNKMFDLEFNIKNLINISIQRVLNCKGIKNYSIDLIMSKYDIINFTLELKFNANTVLIEYCTEGDLCIDNKNKYNLNKHSMEEFEIYLMKYLNELKIDIKM